MSPSLQAALARDVTTLALCWKLTRSDGLVLGFTGHDRDLRLEGVEYLARPGMTPSAVTLSSSFSADSMDVEGVLGAASLSALDLDAGRWSGARMELFACDWTAPEAGMLQLMRGTMGDVLRQGDGAGGTFRVELVSEMAGLGEAVLVRCSPTCRAELGDGRCAVDLAGRTRTAKVLVALGQELELDEAVARPGDYANGSLRVVTGPLTGLDRRVEQVIGARVILEEQLFQPGLAGATILMREGCDKRFATCAGRFGNAAAFDGEPHVPGTDSLIRYGQL